MNIDAQDAQDSQDWTQLQGKLVLAMIRPGCADARDCTTPESEKKLSRKILYILCIHVDKKTQKTWIDRMHRITKPGLCSTGS